MRVPLQLCHTPLPVFPTSCVPLLVVPRTQVRLVRPTPRMSNPSFVQPLVCPTLCMSNPPSYVRALEPTYVQSLVRPTLVCPTLYVLIPTASMSHSMYVYTHCIRRHRFIKFAYLVELTKVQNTYGTWPVHGIEKYETLSAIRNRAEAAETFL